MSKRILVTGGAGFIGSNLLRQLAGDVGIDCLVALDAMTYAGNWENLAGIAGDRIRRVEGDIADAPLVRSIFNEWNIDAIIHLAAESHVDRSIDDPLCFVRTNVLGTGVLLHEARCAWGERKDVRFHHVSTDEVFGSLPESGAFSETTPYDPSSPYSASKAGSDHLVRAWYRTFGLPVTISNCSNNYGPYQHPEKLIPHMITCALEGRPLPVYGKGANVRDWLHVDDHCRAIWSIVTKGRVGETYCVGGGAEERNLAVVEQICDVLQDLLPRSNGYRSLINFVRDRPGHDLRYAIDSSRLTGELSWKPRHTFASGLRATIQWYLDHQDWITLRREQGWKGGRLGLSPQTGKP